MEDLLDLDEAPEAPLRPRVCCDERPCQLLGDGRNSLPMGPGHPARVDDAYPRHGPCNRFSMVEPFQGWRPLSVTPRRTKREFAHCMAELVEVHFPAAERIRIVLDTLSPQTPAALYEVFPPPEARRMRRKLAWHPTPVHGRWVNMAEIELAVLTRQCLNRRISDETTMAREVAAWEARRNRHQAVIDWRVTTTEARITLKSLYPKESL
jgi:DDE superfamily endonuclease